MHVIRKQPKGGHAPGDLIKINGVDFVINKFSSDRYYTQTIAYGGALQEGVIAKVFYVRDKIMRVDILSDKTIKNNYETKSDK